MASLGRAEFNTPALREKLHRTWLRSGYAPPSFLLAYEPQEGSWYFVVEDTTPVLELVDEGGVIYIALKSKCPVHDEIYVCSEVQGIQEVPVSDRQFFAWEELTPLVEEEYEAI